MTYTADDLDVLTRTIWGEARGETPEGRIAVGWTIRNRVFDGKTKSWWGEGYRGVCTAPWQFSCWNANDPNSAYLLGTKPIPAKEYDMCKVAALAVLDGVVDPSKGATHYFVTKMKNPPAWRLKATLTAVIGAHSFYNKVP